MSWQPAGLSRQITHAASHPPLAAPTIGAGLGFAHFATEDPSALFDGKLVGDAEPAVHCASGRAIALQGFIEGESPEEEPYFLHVVDAAAGGAPRVFQDPTMFEAFVAVEGAYYEALGGAEGEAVAGGPFAETVIVDSSPREDAEDAATAAAPPYDCRVSLLLVPAPSGLYDDGSGGGYEDGGAWADDIFGEGEYDGIEGDDGYEPGEEL